MPGVPQENIDDIWPLVEIAMSGTVHEPGFDINYYKEKCLTGDLILWVVRNGKAAIMLEVLEYPKGRCCDILTLAGYEIDSWLDELSEIEAWAKRQGCNKMTLTGRKGWVRMLSDYKIKEVVLEKEL